jgi:two-component system CheB/CheR fusion protein
MTESKAVPVGEFLPPREDKRPTIVGIGASAGGLQALKEFFAAVPADSGLSWVVVIHLAAGRESHLADLLQPLAHMPVTQVTQMTPLEPNQVYVIPPDHNLSAIDSHLRLTPLEPDRLDRAPVDHFFRTLAEQFDGHSVAVILTGTGSDGAQGVRRIRERGGIVIVQDPKEAEFDGMPRSALDSGAVDIVLPVREIPQRIVDLVKTRPRVRQATEPDVVPDANGDLVPRILTWVRTRTDHDFSRYKQTTVERRVARRMQLLGVEQPSDYLELLRGSAEETAALADDLLINVTSFFRDHAVFDYLEHNVVPYLFRDKGPNHRLRVWSVGAATGEEAYSLGMLLLEEAARHEEPPQIQIFASDLHEPSLRQARDGLYPDSIAADVTSERLERFFQKENGGYRVKKELRERIVFAPHNLLRDPPFSHIDLVACRNVLIYLKRDVQDEVMELFHYALHGEGYLLLGTAEMADRSDLFRLESKEHHLYRRRNVPGAHGRVPTLPLPPRLALPVTPAAPPRADGAGGYGPLHQRLVERYAPPSILVDDDHTVLHVSEHAGRYLQVSGGVISNNLFRLVREELRTELRAALLLSRERETPSRSRPIEVSIDGEVRRVVLRVSPTGSKETAGVALVIFDEATDSASVQGDGTIRHHDDAKVEGLESDLEITRGRLQAIVEEFESSQEEMRASNEELQSANEELRSTMEELETSREELQSINEELQTVNQENRHKVDELSQLSSDLQNLLKVTDIAIMFLDRALRINRFTPRVGELFNVRHSDRGRPLADLTHRLGYDGLLDDAHKVLETLVPIEREVEVEDGRWFLIRLIPYRTVDDRIEGVVITLVDVSPLKHTEKALREGESRLEQRVSERTRERDALRRALTLAEEGERRRLARELHDEAGQRLTALGLGLQSLSDVLPPGSEADRRAAQLRSLTDALARELHAVAVRLRPKALDDFGLEAALTAFAEEWSSQTSIPVDVHADPTTERLPPELESAVYRILQEALTNVAKHSGAKRASVVVERREGNVVAIVEDDGKGFDVAVIERQAAKPAFAGLAKLGLLGVRERAALLGGSVEIESKPGKGTTLFARIPIPGTRA